MLYISGILLCTLLIVKCADVSICIPHITDFPPTAKFSYRAEFQL